MPKQKRPAHQSGWIAGLSGNLNKPRRLQLSHQTPVAPSSRIGARTTTEHHQATHHRSHSTGSYICLASPGAERLTALLVSPQVLAAERQASLTKYILLQSRPARRSILISLAPAGASAEPLKQACQQGSRVGWVQSRSPVTVSCGIHGFPRRARTPRRRCRPSGQQSPRVFLEPRRGCSPRYRPAMCLRGSCCLTRR